jgi:hypothetical protein
MRILNGDLIRSTNCKNAVTISISMSIMDGISITRLTDTLIRGALVIRVFSGLIPELGIY